VAVAQLLNFIEFFNDGDTAFINEILQRIYFLSDADVVGE